MSDGYYDPKTTQFNERREPDMREMRDEFNRRMEFDRRHEHDRREEFD